VVYVGTGSGIIGDLAGIYGIIFNEMLNMQKSIFRINYNDINN
jgi:hypothetical protein